MLDSYNGGKNSGSAGASGPNMFLYCMPGRDLVFTSTSRISGNDLIAAPSVHVQQEFHKSLTNSFSQITATPRFI